MGKPNTIGSINCLQYADDTIIFSNASTDQFSILKLILYSFKLLWSLEINFQKSDIIGINLNKEESRMFAKMLGCQVGQLPISYLGIPLHYSSIKMNGWRFLLKKIEKKLSSWKQKDLNFSRAPHSYQLVAKCNSDLLDVNLSPPTSVIHKINYIYHYFLWGGHGDCSKVKFLARDFAEYRTIKFRIYRETSVYLKVNKTNKFFILAALD